MTDTVFCKLLQEELPRLDAPPFPGAKGEEIFRHYSAKAWQQWQDLQTMLINEKHLNMMDRRIGVISPSNATSFSPEPMSIKPKVIPHPSFKSRIDHSLLER